jgi:predicted flap endonuclease-1-like 5' DNA nuclease
MRSDYALYTVAIILFLITGIVLVSIETYTQLWTVTTAVLGFLFVGLGYSLRPRSRPQTTIVTAPPPPPAASAPAPEIVQPTAPPTTSVTTEVIEEKQPEITVETVPPTPPTIEIELTKVKGIGEKRAGQLQTLGINTIEELSKASAKDLATKLKISPKITGKWIDNAKELVEKS